MSTPEGQPVHNRIELKQIKLNQTKTNEIKPNDSLGLSYFNTSKKTVPVHRSNLPKTLPLGVRFLKILLQRLNSQHGLRRRKKKKEGRNQRRAESSQAERKEGCL